MRTVSYRVATSLMLVSSWVCATFDFTATTCLAEEVSPEKGYEKIWHAISEPLRLREYATAAAILDAYAENPKYRSFGAQIAQDREVIGGLQTLRRVVYEQATKLPEGKQLDIYGIDYRFVRYEMTPKGDELVLQMQVTGQEQRKLISRLPSSTWMELAELKPAALKSPSLILGVFMGFDRSPDFVAARKFFDDAASQGANVTTWLTRLNETKPKPQVDQKDGEKGAFDPIVGHWRISVKNYMVFSLEFRANGTNLATVSPSTIADLRRRSLPLPPANPGKGKWSKSDVGSYRVTMVNGATFELRQVGDRLVGKTAAGVDVLGLRQADR